MTFGQSPPFDPQFELAVFKTSQSTPTLMEPCREQQESRLPNGVFMPEGCFAPAIHIDCHKN
jgi:hypothetical protein